MHEKSFKRTGGKMRNATHWPSELRLKENGRLLHIKFDDGGEYALAAEYLRVMSPSAEVQGHREEDRVTVGGKRNCVIIGVEPVGAYAVRLSFDDLHTTGIFTWDYLYDLGAGFDQKWAKYEAELKSKGLDRDKPGQA
ncbi:conserved hypothetical protein [Methylocella tundrae]|nr:conserved hypothetical protein [Methylocella tundrae]